MPATISEARDEMAALLKDGIAAAQSGYNNVLILWDDSTPNPPDDTETPWLRFTARHADGGNASLGGGNGKKRRYRAGIIGVQVFTKPGDGRSTADVLVSIIMGVYEDARDGAVWFRNVRFQEIGLSGGWQQTNVLADFEYDEVR